MGFIIMFTGLPLVYQCLSLFMLVASSVRLYESCKKLWGGTADHGRNLQIDSNYSNFDWFLQARID